MAAVAHLSVPPVLSTPESHIFEDPTPATDISALPQLTDDELLVRYEIDRTVKEIRNGGWKRIALQFPDDMLGDGVRVYKFLKQRLALARHDQQAQQSTTDNGPKEQQEPLEQNMGALELDGQAPADSQMDVDEQLSILADTSYGSCCVDEIAAEHVDADAVVHYGRSCLSPTARLPVIYVFTSRELNSDSVVRAFKDTYPDTTRKVILIGDLPYHNHLASIAERLQDEGYVDILVPDIIHSPASLLPNRTLPTPISENAELLMAYALFHVGQPPPALLLTLTSRVASIHVYAGDHEPTACPALTTPTLRRRYALLTSLGTESIFGILVNTLSVKNYLHVVAHVQKMISAAGKKSYTFVVGKVNPAKIANFAEIGGWVVIGCWESSLVESRDFFRPLVTPFELELALMSDRTRQWSGEWRSDFDAVLRRDQDTVKGTDMQEAGEDDGASGNGDESAPPEFNLRSGRYISHTRPMRAAHDAQTGVEDAASGSHQTSQSLTKRANGALAQIGGIASPGAEYLQSSRTWKGLASDYEIKYDESGATIEEGRSGVARGYVVGDAGKSDRH